MCVWGAYGEGEGRGACGEGEGTRRAPAGMQLHRRRAASTQMAAHSSSGNPNLRPVGWLTPCHLPLREPCAQHVAS